VGAVRPVAVAALIFPGLGLLADRQLAHELLVKVAESDLLDVVTRRLFGVITGGLLDRSFAAQDLLGFGDGAGCIGERGVEGCEDFRGGQHAFGLRGLEGSGACPNLLGGGFDDLAGTFARRGLGLSPLTNPPPG
jgi:hypothetical protein